MSQKAISVTNKGILFSGLFFVLAMNSYAVNMQYLRYSPVSEFTDADFEMLQTTGINALDNNDNGQASEWKNPETEHFGSITPHDSTTVDGMSCRKATIKNQTKTHSGQSTFTFCKVKGKWKLLK